MKHRIGDVVEIRNDLALNERYWMEDHSTSDFFVYGMHEYSGSKATVKNYKLGKYILDIDYGDYYWTDSMFVGHKPNADASVQISCDELIEFLTST